MSFFMYVVIVFYTIQKFRKANPMLLVRYTVVALILIQYALALSCLSSYNSPQSFPPDLTQLTNSTVYTVYPNQD